MTAGEYLFVYGTLMRDANGSIHPYLKDHAEFVDSAGFRGKLYKVDYYPGAVPSNRTGDRVSGEVYRLIEPEKAFTILDDYEEVGPAFSEPNEYRRVKQTVRLSDNRSVEAWLYLYNRTTDGLPLIESSCFERRR